MSALTMLEAHTADNTSANLDFTSCITSAYDEYEIHIVNLIPATDTASIQIRMSTDGGATYDSGANYDCNIFHWLNGSSGTSGGGAGQNGVALATNIHNTALGGICYRLTLSSPLSASANKMLCGIGMANDATGPRLLGWAESSWYNNTAAVNAFRVLASSGNLLSGIVRVYGVASSAPPAFQGGLLVSDDERGGFQIIGCPISI